MNTEDYQAFTSEEKQLCDLVGFDVDRCKVRVATPSGWDVCNTLLPCLLHTDGAF